MKISIWQQFSSNHSSDVWFVGKFESVEARQAAEKVVRQLTQSDLRGDDHEGWTIATYDTVLELTGGDAWHWYTDNKPMPAFQQVMDTFKNSETSVLGGVDCDAPVYRLSFEAKDEAAAAAVQSLFDDIDEFMTDVDSPKAEMFDDRFVDTFGDLFTLTRDGLHFTVEPLLLMVEATDDDLSLPEMNALLHKYLAHPVEFTPLAAG